MKGPTKYPEYSSECFLNRELSWLEFNARTLEEASCPETPLLEKIRFLSISTSNLDEFFMVRVAGLKKMRKEGFSLCESPDRMPITSALKKIRQRTDEILAAQQSCLATDILPKLGKQGIKLLSYADTKGKLRAQLKEYFETEVFPILTPLAVDPTHPLPFLNNLSIFLLVEFQGEGETLVGFVEVPSIISRLIPVHPSLKDDSKEEYHFVHLEDLIRSHLDMLFLGLKASNCSMIRVTRNLDYKLLENNVVDLLESVQKEVTNRELQEIVRLEIWGSPSDATYQKLLRLLDVENDDTFLCPSMTSIQSLVELYTLPLEHLREPEFNPRIPARIANERRDIFAIVRSKDLLIHLPYESFYTVAEFLSAAANDPDVLAIKQTLYRCSENSPVIDSLIRASENGKQVTAIVELKARFDEKNNIIWAQRLERAGVNVVYGFIRLKTHCKACLIVRKENKKLVRYVHLATGNYNPITARQYTDFGVFSAWEPLGRDISALFNFLTGFNFLSRQVNKKQEFVPKFGQILVAPINMREGIAAEISHLIRQSEGGQETSIAAKMNGLADPALISLFYKASQAGVRIRLIVRGICCLRPGIKGVSDNIAVVSIVDRFLEHGRVYIFNSATQRRVFLGSADLMPRNMDRRVEILFPVTDIETQERIVTEIFEGSWKDNVKARRLKSNGEYVLQKPGSNEKAHRSQSLFIQLVREAGIKSIPYEKAIRYDALKKKGRRPIAKRSVSKELQRKR